MRSLAATVAFESNNPCRAPDWRWEAAGRLAEQEPPPEASAVDTLLATALAFRRRGVRYPHEANPAGAGEPGPFLGEVWQLSQTRDATRGELEARLLAGQTDAVIASHLGLAPGVVNVYEAVFFHVRDRLRCRDWLAGSAVGPGLRTGFRRDDVGGVWKALAFLGGERVLEVALAVVLHRPWPDGVVPRHRSRAFGTRLRRSVQRLLGALSEPPVGSWPAPHPVDPEDSIRGQETASAPTTGSPREALGALPEGVRSRPPAPGVNPTKPPRRRARRTPKGIAFPATNRPPPCPPDPT